MIALTKLRELDLAAAPSTGRPAHVSAASGLACIHSYIYVVADDELHVGVFRAADPRPGHLIRLFDGALPESKPERKKQKPDLEALALLPADGGYPHGALLALGSGSRRNRRMGALLGLDAQGAILGLPRAVDCSPIFAPLSREFPALNIEGALAIGGELRLFQRGNRKNPASAIIRFQLSEVLDALKSERTSTVAPDAIHRFDLGQIDGIPYSFTDAAALPDGGMVFTAIAEDTNDSYNGGSCVAAAIGLMDEDGRLCWLQQLDRPDKIEGVDARMDGRIIRLLLVTDADDASIPAGLFSAAIEK